MFKRPNNVHRLVEYSQIKRATEKKYIYKQRLRKHLISAIYSFPRHFM